MKTDRQFIESIYAKRADKAEKQRKYAILAISAVLLLSVTSSIFILNPNDKKGGFDNSNTIANTDFSANDSSAKDKNPNGESVDTTEASEGNDHVLPTLLACPDIKNENEAMGQVELNERFNISAPFECDFHNVLKEHKNDNTQFLVGIFIDRSDTFTYNGRYLSEIFTDDNCFNDDNHKEFNDFMSNYAVWYEADTYNTVLLDLHNKANAGDAAAAERLMAYSKYHEEEAFYYTVWKNDKSEEYIAEFMKQCEEYEAIWASYRDFITTSSPDVYEAEAERLSDLGYLVECVEYRGTTIITGKLTASQILDFDKADRLSYSCSWLPENYQDADATDAEIEMDE